MELLRALAALAEAPGPEQGRIGAALGLPEIPYPPAYTDLFALQLYPYASVYLGPEGMLGGEARERVAGFWRALRCIPPGEPDHLTVLLALYAALAEQEASESDRARRLLWGRSRKALLWEHLASWLFLYLDKLSEISPPFYRGWGDLLAEALVAEIGIVGPPDTLPLHLREAPPLLDPRHAGAEAFLRGLLAPVRSGIVLARADLARAARDTRLGGRVGERLFILRSLFGQDADGTLAWLEREARGWIPKHLARRSASGDVAHFWAGRAEATAALLTELQREPASPGQEYGGPAGN
jgi:nitrate reductase delta subunit